MTGLTERQKEIYDFIEAYIQERGYSPSYREIQKHFAFSSLGTVHKHLSVLKRKGVLSSESHCGRSLAPTMSKKGQQTDVAVPFIGELTAYSAVETFAQIQTLSLPPFLVGNPTTTYVLRARGSAWVEEQIADGDLVVVEAQREADPGETVIARLHGAHTTIKRLFPEGQHLRLIGGTPNSEPLLLRADQVEIQGIVIGVIRLYT